MSAIFDLDELVEDTELVDPVEAAREEWLRKRAGKLTCSRFGDLVGEGREKGALFTKTGYAYLRQLAAEKLGSWHSISASSLEWGTSNEPKAIEEYVKRTGAIVDSAPYRYFAYNEAIGGTPDGLVAVDGCIEVKCPYNPEVHVSTMLSREVPKDYEWQVVGHMLVTGRAWCDFISYDPRMDDPYNLIVIRTIRDEVRIEFLKKRLWLAVGELNLMMSKIKTGLYSCKLEN